MLFWYSSGIHLLLNMLNYVLLVTVSFFFIIKFLNKKKLSEFKIFLFIIFFLITPFLFNNDFTFHWSAFPDQSKYLRNIYLLRNLIFQITDSNILMKATGALFYFIPIGFYENFVSVGLGSRFILLIFFFYLLNRDENFNLLILFILLSPGIILYSSLSLREVLVWVTTFFIFDFYNRKKIVLLLISLIYLYLIKFQYAYYLLLLLSFHFFIFNEKKINIKIIFCLIFTSLFLIFFDEFAKIIFHHRYHLSLEDNVVVSYTPNIFELLKYLFYGFFNFLFSPIPTNFKTLFIFFDTLFIYLFIFYCIKSNYSLKNINSIIFTFIILISLFSIYGFMVSNDITLHRYKISIILLAIYPLLLFKKKIKKNEKNYIYN